MPCTTGPRAGHCHLCQLGVGQGPRMALASLGTGPWVPTPSLWGCSHTFPVGLFPRAAAPVPGPWSPPRATAVRGERSATHLTAALSALPPRVPRGRHEPVPPVPVAGRIGHGSARRGDLGAAETLRRYGTGGTPSHVVVVAPWGTATPWCPLRAGHRALTASPLCAGGDRSSLGSTGSVASARSSGSGQSAGSGAHALHAGSEGVKVRRAPRRPCQLLLAALLQRLLPALTSAAA